MAGTHISPTATIDSVSTVVANKLADDSKQFIGMKVAPVALMDVAAGKYPYFGRDEYKVDSEDKDFIGPRGEAQTYEDTMSLDTYDTRLRGEKYVLAEIERQKYNLIFGVEMAKKLPVLVRRRLRKHELAVATLVQDKAKYHADNQLDIDALANRRWDETAGTPLQDIDHSIGEVEKITGVAPNTILFPRGVWSTFRYHADVIKAIHGAYGGPIGRQELTSIFPELETVLVGRGTYDSAKKGATRVPVRMWNGKNCILLHVGMGDESVPTAVRTFVWKIEGGADVGSGMFVTTDRIPGVGGGLGAQVGEVDWAYDVKLVGKDVPGDSGLLIAGFCLVGVIG